MDWYRIRDNTLALLFLIVVAVSVLACLVAAVGTAMAITGGFIWLFFGEAPKMVARPVTVYLIALAWLGVVYLAKEKWL